MVEMTCEEHDRQAASTQFVTHTVGRMLGAMELKSTDINTKGFEVGGGRGMVALRFLWVAAGEVTSVCHLSCHRMRSQSCHRMLSRSCHQSPCCCFDSRGRPSQYQASCSWVQP